MLRRRSKNQNQKNQNGFTLLELLVYMGILTVVMVYLVQAFANISRGQGQNETQADVVSNLTFAAEKIDADIRAASAVSQPATAGTTAANLTLTVNGSTVLYCVVSGVLYREATSGICSASSTPVTSSSVTIAAPTFTRVENTNSSTSKTYVSIETVLSASNASQNPDAQFSMTKQLSSALR